MLMNWHELESRHAERFEMRNRGIRGDPQEGTAELGRNRRMPTRKSADVQLVEDRIVPKDSRRAVAAPVEGIVYDHALGFSRSVVAIVEEQIVERAVPRITIDRRAEVEPALERARVRVHEELVRVETVPFAGCKGAVHSPPVALPRSQPHDVKMPDVKRAPRNAHTRFVSRVVEQA